ncbi:hypothetical protein BS47DRAFT_1489887 [Hydnum rufescens UP504]|uniref:PI31 proteasome regulator C-terminal domain-containing protein n=1 Tax=Hydnum rufescens UP504 TaxID=1448309 RepID=A0A9P6DNH1_9AGAM|nr:hypothetical protein BS47DRAFT_1489887 [Hydnum rufescens UP504]
MSIAKGYEEKSVAVTTESVAATTSSRFVSVSSNTSGPLPFRPSPSSIPPNPDSTGQPFALPRPNYSPNNPLEIGRSDLEPLGGRNPLASSPHFPGGRGSRGMVVGPSQFFGDRMEPRWGGDGFLPPMGAPPGARFDPELASREVTEESDLAGVVVPHSPTIMPPGAVYHHTLVSDWRIGADLSSGPNFSHSVTCRARQGNKTGNETLKPNFYGDDYDGNRRDHLQILLEC